MADEPRAALSPSLTAFWTAAWVLIGTVHLTMSIWSSAGASLPGDLGDGRFNNLVLEHGYQAWIHDAYPWRSPGQFHPTPHTLSWSDTHAGTLPGYALARTLGLSAERSMQFWFILVAALNLASAVKLFRTLKISTAWAPPMAAIAFAGVPWVWMTGTHAQLMPIFPGIWSAVFLVRYSENRSWRMLTMVVGAGLAQFAAGPYLAFFTAATLAAATWIGWSLNRFLPALPPAPPQPVQRLSGSGIGLVGIGALLGILNLWVYGAAVGSGVGRPLQEVINLAPSWSSWFSASPAHRWWDAGWPGGQSGSE